MWLKSNKQHPAWDLVQALGYVLCIVLLVKGADQLGKEYTLTSTSPYVVKRAIPTPAPTSTPTLAPVSAPARYARVSDEAAVEGLPPEYHVFETTKLMIKLYDSLVAGDRATATSILAGNVLLPKEKQLIRLVAGGTKVRVLERCTDAGRYVAVKVRVEEGEHAGYTGFMLNETLDFTASAKEGKP